MNKVLFIIQSYPSRRSANVLCDEKIMRALLADGNYEIHCLTYRYNGQSRYEEIDGFKIHRFGKGAFWKLYTWSRDHEDTVRSKIIAKLNRLALRLKQLVTIPIYPCHEPFFSRKYAREAKKLHKRQQFDLVISEHNGFDTLYAGYRLKKSFPQIKYMPVFWDSLSGGFHAKYLPESYCKRRKLKLEEKVLGACDCAAAMLSHKAHMEQTWANAWFYDKIHFLNIPYLVKPAPPSEHLALLDKTKINLVFAGSMQARNPEYTIRLLQQINRPDIVLWLICDKPYHKRLKDILGDEKEKIKIHCYIPNHELMDVLHGADILWNMGVKNPNAISGKIFEHMAFGKPIVSTHSIDNEACLPYLKRYPLSLLIDERETDLQKQARALEQFIDLVKGKTVSFEQVAEGFRENTPRAYVELINQVMESK